MGIFDWFKDDDPKAAPLTPAAPTPVDISASLDSLETKMRGSDLSTAVVYRVGRISARLRETLPRMSNSGLTSVDQYSLIATATSYLPQTIGGYVRLPRDWADSRPVDTGRSSLLVLIDQLDLLAATVDKIYDAVITRDAQALIVQGKFLAEKFAPSTPAPKPLAPVTTPATTLDLG